METIHVKFDELTAIASEHDTHEAPPIVTTSEEQTSPIYLTVADEFYQKDSTKLDGNTELTFQKSLEHHTESYDPTLFIRRHEGDILLIQVYVDDIIFGFINPDFLKRFANLMKNNFEMSMMGEVKFFLGLQVHQSPRGIFISQSQYAIELLKKHGMDECVSMSTHMATKRLDADLQGTPTEQMTYRRMIKGFMYLTASRPDISFATFVCARYQARPTFKHLKEVKRIFLYLRQSYNMGLWYPKDSGFELIAYSDAHHAGCQDDCKSTSGGIQLLVIIMAQPQRPADVHQDELCPPNKRYALMDANKNVNLENPLLSWIYLGQFWHTLQEDGSKYKLKFMLDRKELTLTLDDFRTIFHLPQSTYNNHDHFVPALKFSEIVPFYINNLGFTLEIRSTLNFKTTGLLQLWQTLYHNLEDDVMIKSIFNSGKSKYVVGMKIPDWMITDEMKLTENYQLYAEVFGVDVPTTQSQPIESTQGTHRITSAPRTPNPDIVEGESSAPRKSTVIRLCIPPRRSTRLTSPTPIPTNDEADDLVLQDKLQVSLAEQKSHKELKATQNVEKVKEHLMAEEIKKLVEGTENVEENVVVVSSPLRNDDNQTNPGTRLEPKSDKERPEVEKIADISQPVNVIEEEEELTKDDYVLKRMEKGKEIEESRNTPSPTTTRSLSIHSTLISSDTEKLQELTETDTIPSSSTPSSYSFKLSATNRLLSLFKSKPGRFKRYKSFFDVMMESLPKMVDERIKKILQTQVPLHVAQGIILEREKSQAGVDSSVRSYMSGHVLHVYPTQATLTNAQEQQHQLYLTMKDNPQLQQDDLLIWLTLKYKFERLYMATTPCRTSDVRPRDQDDPHDDAHLEGENSAKSNQEQSDDFDFWTNSYATYDDVLSNEKVSQELVDEMSHNVDEAKLHKVVDEMLRQQCTSGDEHQYHIDQMQNFLKSDIVWESMKEIIVPPYQPKPTTVVQSFQRDPKAPTLSLVNQDLLYLKKGNTGPEKIALSLHKFLVVRFPDNDIEERTSRRVTKFVPADSSSSISADYVSAGHVLVSADRDRIC
ncbi:retrovirus-related pol polyprotein from transposon TNT 1-94 [Tanacetum coccineum]